MRRVVYKYPFNDGNYAAMEVPAGDVLLVAAQRPSDQWPTVWIEFDPTATFTTMLAVVGTGHPVDEEGMSHVGSAVCFDGSLVWHVYEVAS